MCDFERRAGKSVRSARGGRDQDFTRESDAIMKRPYITEVMNEKRSEAGDRHKPLALCICKTMYKVSLL